MTGTYVGQTSQVAIVVRLDLTAEGGLVSGDFGLRTSDGVNRHHSFRSGPIPEAGLPVEATVFLDISPDGSVQGRLRLTPAENDGELMCHYEVVAVATRDTPAIEVEVRLRRSDTHLRSLGLRTPCLGCSNEMKAEFQVVMNEGVEDRPSVVEAFSSAKVSLRWDGTFDQLIVDDLIGEDGWSDEELHSAMTRAQQNRSPPAWEAYLLLADRHEDPLVAGVMFDREGHAAREGAAIFLDHAAFSGPNTKRALAHAVMHELGHVLNLPHCFEPVLRGFSSGFGRPEALTWMNYPKLFPHGAARPSGWDGTEEFWAQFKCTYDAQELDHILHGFEAEVAPGGNFFGADTALLFDGPGPDGGLGRQKIEVSLRVPAHVHFLERFTGEVKVANNGHEPVETFRRVGSEYGNLDVYICKNNSNSWQLARAFRFSCQMGEKEDLPVGDRRYYIVEVQVGASGWYVDDPGMYRFRAVAHFPDGRMVSSNVASTRVLAPEQSSHEVLAADILSPTYAHYFALRGSRSPGLSKERSLLMELREREPSLRLSDQAWRDDIVMRLRPNRLDDRAPNWHEGLVEELLAITPNQRSHDDRFVDGVSNLAFSRDLFAAARAALANDDSRSGELARDRLVRMTTEVGISGLPADQLRKAVEATLTSGKAR